MTNFSWTPDPATGISVRMVEANGQTFEHVGCGSGDLPDCAKPLVCF